MCDSHCTIITCLFLSIWHSDKNHNRQGAPTVDGSAGVPRMVDCEVLLNLMFGIPSPQTANPPLTSITWSRLSSSCLPDRQRSSFIR